MIQNEIEKKTSNEDVKQQGILIHRNFPNTDKMFSFALAGMA